jgi:hypothetical protein
VYERLVRALSTPLYVSTEAVGAVRLSGASLG